MSIHDDSPRFSITPCRGAVIYALFGLLWIYFSDAALNAIVTNPDRLNALQTYKGCLYIVITAVLVYWLLQKHGFEIEQYNENIRENKASLDLVLRALPLGVATLKDRRFTSANDTLCDILGYSREEIVGCEARKFYPSEAEFERVGKAVYSETSRKGRCFIAACLKHKNGHELNVLLGAAVAHEGALPMDIVLSAMDITEQHEKEALYQLLFEEAHDGLVLMDGQQFVDCNASALRIYGMERERFIGASPFNFSPDRQPDGTESGKAGLQHINAALAGEPQVFEWRHLRGGTVPFDAEISLNCIQRGGKQYLLAMVRDITERKQMLEALHESEEYLSSIFRTVPTGIGVVQNRTLKTINDRFCEIFGYSRDELLEDGTKKLYISGEEFQRCGKAIYEQLDQKNVSTVEARMIRKDGREINVLINSSRLSAIEKDNAVISSILDITALKLAEEQLRGSEERFKALHNASFGGIAIHDKGVILDCNQGLSDITGYNVDDLIGMDGLLLVAERSRDLVMGNIQSAYEEPYEATGLRKNGEEYPLRIAAKMIPYQGKTMRVVEFRDITENKRVEEARKESEEQYRHLVEDIGDRFCLFRHTLDGIVTYLSPGFRIMFGKSIDTALNCNWKHVLDWHPESLEAGEHMMKEMVAHKISHKSFELVCRREDGSDMILEISEHLVRDSQANPVGVEGIAIDITDRKRAEDALLAHRDKLEEMVRERTEELTESNAELQRLIEFSEDRSEQAALLNEMGELLQACETEDETYLVAKGVCSKLFPHDSGCIGILDAADGNINIVGSWGKVHSCSREFAYNECWAIRRGKAHMVLRPETDPLCNHVRSKPECGTVCIPMSAQGKVLGIAHMLFDRTLAQFQESERQRIIEEKCVLLAGLVERYAPSLVNLRLRESLREQSIRDRLTGLFNRRHMETVLSREFARARRRETPIVIVMIDVDHFKRFNDRYGHETGDNVLRKLGRFLISLVRKEDIPCRYGGEELLLIMPDCSLNDGVVKAESIRRGIEEDVMVVHNGERLQLTASLGVASYPLHGEDVETVIASADNALYRAKKGGRNQVITCGG